MNLTQAEIFDNLFQSYKLGNIDEVLSVIDEEIMGKSEDLIEFVEDRPGHDLRYSMDSSKSMKNLGWNVKSNFEDGLEKTIQWYLENPGILNNISNALEPTPWKNSN